MRPQKRPRPQVFTIDRLLAIKGNRETLDLKDVLEAFPELTYREITQRLAQKRKKGVITCDQGYKNIVINRTSTKAPELRARDELGAYLTWLAVADVYELTALLEGHDLRPKERLEAIKSRIRARQAITNPLAIEYAKSWEDRQNVRNAWQDWDQDTEKA